MMFQTHVGEHPDVLTSQLCELMASVPDDPFAPELVAVPTRGIERWLTQRIATGTGGICANVEFTNPNRLIKDIIKPLPELAAVTTAWERKSVISNILTVFDRNPFREELKLISRYIKGTGDWTTPDNGHRWLAASKIAELYESYTRRCPDMIRAWHTSIDIDANSQPLLEHARWQPWLWRKTRQQIGVPSLAELLPEALDPIRSGSVDLPLPDRFFVYGLTSVNTLDLAVLKAAATQKTVHLFLLHPSSALWETSNTDNNPDGSVEHPLLRTWGKESIRLHSAFGKEANWIRAHPGTDNPGNITLLHKLQADIRGNCTPSPDKQTTSRSDRSIQIHSTHGDRRQVEVLKDAILHVLADNPSLEPRDVIILTPEIGTFAPLVKSVFSRGVRNRSDKTSPAGDHHRLRVRVSDRAPTARNPLARFVSTVFDLAEGRAEAGEIKTLLSHQVVKQQFGLDQDIIQQIEHLIDDSNVCWGLDRGHIFRWDAGSHIGNTWRSGLDRTLSGVFYSDDDLTVIDGITPLDGMEGQEARPAGLLAQILDRVATVSEMLRQSRPYSQWDTAIVDAVRLLAAPESKNADKQWSHLRKLLHDAFHITGPVDPVISPAAARMALEKWDNPRPSSLHFNTGYITVGTLAPMRSVPHRVICLLGMDDSRFPRRNPEDGDNLLMGTAADRDRAEEDRQMLLDAVMAAADNLIITYSGRDPQTNTVYPPSVPISELLDTISNMTDEPVNDIVVDHPLQPYSLHNFSTGKGTLRGGRPWSFDWLQYNAAKAYNRRHNETTPSPSDVKFAPADAPDEITLDSLVRFYSNPAKEFLRYRLGFTVPALPETSDDVVLTELSPLDQWGLTDRMLTGVTEGAELNMLAKREQGSGSLPPNEPGSRALDAAWSLAGTLCDIANQEGGYRPECQQPFAGSVTAGGMTVSGTVTADPNLGRFFMLTPSRLKAKHRLELTASLVFLTALDPSTQWSGYLIGRHRRGTNLNVVVASMAGEVEARQHQSLRVLSGLTGLYKEGLSSPLPLPCETSYVWQSHIADNKNPEPPTRHQWETTGYGFGSWSSAEWDGLTYGILFPGLSTLSALSSPDTRFCEYAERLWNPMLPLMDDGKMIPVNESAAR